MEDSRRVFIAILASLAILLVWQELGPRLFPQWFPTPPVPGAVDGGTPGQAVAAADGGAAAQAAAAPDGGAAAQVAVTAGADGGTPGQAAVAAGTQAKPAKPAPPKNVPPAQPAKTVVIHNDVVRATFSTQGGAVAHWVLLGKRLTENVPPGHKGKAPQIDLVQLDPGQPLPFSTTFAELPWPADASYTVAARTDHSVTFRASAGGITVEKTFTLTPGRFDLGFSLKATDASGAARKLTPTVLLARSFTPPKVKGGLLSHLSRSLPDVVQAACAVQGKLETRHYDKDKSPYAHTGEVDWTGIDSRYFLTAVFLGKPAFEGETDPAGSATCTAGAPTEHHFESRLTAPALTIPAGGSASLRLTGFLGPKFRGRLTAYGHHLDKSISFGFFTLLALPLLGLLTFLQGLVGNWGWAVILLTVLVRLALFPLTGWSMKSMEKMKLVQPKIKELKDKYGKDQQRFQQEMMKLYKDEGVNPLSGCLPMILQLPLLFALYEMILRTAELYHAPFILGWLSDLSAPEPGLIKILPIAMGITMLITQKMQPQATTGDDTQAKMQKGMLYFMPPFLVLISYQLPSGVVLYWFVSNLLSIFQQLWIRRKQQQAAAAAAA